MVTGSGTTKRIVKSSGTRELVVLQSPVNSRLVHCVQYSKLDLFGVLPALPFVQLCIIPHGGNGSRFS